MRVAEKIEEAQVALFRKIGRDVLTDVRGLEVELEGLRLENARALETLKQCLAAQWQQVTLLCVNEQLRCFLESSCLGKPVWHQLLVENQCGAL